MNVRLLLPACLRRVLQPVALIDVLSPLDPEEIAAAKARNRAERIAAGADPETGKIRRDVDGFPLRTQGLAEIQRATRDNVAHFEAARKLPRSDRGYAFSFKRGEQ